MDEKCIMIILNPASLKRVAIAIYNQESFQESGVSYIPLLNNNSTDQKNAAQVVVPIFDSNNSDDMRDFAEDENNYIFGLVESISINPIDFFTAVDTITYSNFITQVQNDRILTSGSMNIPVTLPFTNDSSDNHYYNSRFLECIWRLGVFYFVPFFLYTDMSPVNLGGPLFCKKFTINVEESSVVSIDFSFIGGSAILPPDNIIPPEAYGIDFPVFRHAKSWDCLVNVGVGSNISNEAGNFSIYEDYGSITSAYSSFGVRIIKATLEIENDITMSFTANDGVNKKAIDGVRFISLKKRKVRGRMTFIATEDLLLMYKNGGLYIQELFLYFSGPFYFPMRNVYFQFFSSKAVGNGGSFEHEIEFNAYVQGQKVGETLNYYQQNEFDISYKGLYEVIGGNIYTEPNNTF